MISSSPWKAGLVPLLLLLAFVGMAGNAQARQLVEDLPDTSGFVDLPPDVFVTAGVISATGLSSLKPQTSGLPALPVGSVINMTVTVGVRGLAGARSVVQNVVLQGKLLGFEVLALTEELDEGACSFTPCLYNSSISCTWPQLQPATMGGQERRLLLSLKATDAGSDAVASLKLIPPMVDADPATDIAEVVAQVKGACCSAAASGGVSCRNVLQKDCIAGSIFSPWASCADGTCIAPSITRKAGAAQRLGVCVTSGNTCLQRVARVDCVKGNGTWYNARLCRKAPAVFVEAAACS